MVNGKGSIYGLDFSRLTFSIAMCLFCTLHLLENVEQKKNIILSGVGKLENIFRTIRLDLNNAIWCNETKEVLKDAIGACAIFAMLYIGLFIPNF